MICNNDATSVVGYFAFRIPVREVTKLFSKVGGVKLNSEELVSRVTVSFQRIEHNGEAIFDYSKSTAVVDAPEFIKNINADIEQIYRNGGADLTIDSVAFGLAGAWPKTRMSTVAAGAAWQDAETLSEERRVESMGGLLGEFKVNFSQNRDSSNIRSSDANSVAAYGFALVSVIVAIGVYLNRRVIRRLTRMAEKVADIRKAVNAGDLLQVHSTHGPITDGSRDELDSLAQNVQDLLVAIRTDRAEKDRAVLEKQAALDQAEAAIVEKQVALELANTSAAEVMRGLVQLESAVGDRAAALEQARAAFHKERETTRIEQLRRHGAQDAEEFRFKIVRHNIIQPLGGLCHLIERGEAAKATDVVKEMLVTVRFLLDEDSSITSVAQDPEDILLFERIANRVNDYHDSYGNFRFEPTLFLNSVSVDPFALDLILRMCSDNAREHRPKGSTIVVRLDRDQRSDVGPCARITVFNEGAQIGENVLQSGRLFELGVTSKSEPGHGIGLYTTKRVALRMGGRVDLRNVDGGVEFRLWIPIMRELDLDNAHLNT